MRILHTADWHLGKRLDHYSRLEEQILVMDEIVAIADENNIDMVIVAGDLFDNFNPSTEAVELFYKTLKRLSNQGKRPVIAISGNHDSPNLIDAPDPLARECGIFLIGHPNAIVQTIETDYFKISKTDAGFMEFELNQYPYPIRILHTPYANEIRLKHYLGEDKEEALNIILAQNWNHLANQYCDENGVNILTAHLYMNQRGMPLMEEPEGEKPIKIGNADMIYSEAIPEQIQYTALGHLHGYKNIGSDAKPVVYSSSPLCYSFSEAGQTKSVSVVDLEPHQPAQFKIIELQNGKPLIRKSFNDIELALEWLNDHPNALVELTLESETFLKAEDRKRLYQTHSGIIHLIPKVKNQNTEALETPSINLNQDIKTLFEDYFKSKNNQQVPNNDLMNLFNEILNQ